MTCSVLAQFGTPSKQFPVMEWCGILALVVLVGSFVIMLIRRQYLKSTKNEAHDPGFSLSGLREMRDRGEITPEEYEAMRARVIAKVKGKHEPPSAGEGDASSGAT